MYGGNIWGGDCGNYHNDNEVNGKADSVEMNIDGSEDDRHPASMYDGRGHYSGGKDRPEYTKMAKEFDSTDEKKYRDRLKDEMFNDIISMNTDTLSNELASLYYFLGLEKDKDSKAFRTWMQCTNIGPLGILFYVDMLDFALLKKWKSAVRDYNTREELVTLYSKGHDQSGDMYKELYNKKLSVKNKSKDKFISDIKTHITDILMSQYDVLSITLFGKYKMETLRNIYVLMSQFAYINTPIYAFGFIHFNKGGGETEQKTSALSKAMMRVKKQYELYYKNVSSGNKLDSSFIFANKSGSKEKVSKDDNEIACFLMAYYFNDTCGHMGFTSGKNIVYHHSGSKSGMGEHDGKKPMNSNMARPNTITHQNQVSLLQRLYKIRKLFFDDM
jgi:hypothetical protein